MPPSLGKMSAYKLFDWRDRAADSAEQNVAAFLKLGEAVATRWVQTRKAVLLLQMVPDDCASGAILAYCDKGTGLILFSSQTTLDLLLR